MGAAYSRRLLAVSSNDADALVNLAPDIFRATGLQEGEAPRAARGEYSLSGILHLRRIRLTGHLLVAQDEPKVTWTHFGKAKAVLFQKFETIAGSRNSSSFRHCGNEESKVCGLMRASL